MVCVQLVGLLSLLGTPAQGSRLPARRTNGSPLEHHSTQCQTVILEKGHQAPDDDEEKGKKQNLRKQFLRKLAEALHSMF